MLFVNLLIFSFYFYWIQDINLEYLYFRFQTMHRFITGQKMFIEVYDFSSFNLPFCYTSPDNL